jgi:PAS domain S-box-containing protein
MKNSGQRVPLWTALSYLVVALAWVAGAHGFLTWLDRRGASWSAFRDHHELIFVLLSTALLYLFLQTSLRRLREAEAEKAAQEERWRQALDQTGDGTARVDLASGVCHCSPKWNLTLGQPALESRATVDELFSAVHADDRAGANGRFAALRDRRESQCRCEHRVRTRDGRHRWMLDRGYIAGTNGHTHLVIQRHDIHAQKLVERAQDFLLRLPSQAEATETLQAMVGFMRREFEVDAVLAGTLEPGGREVRTVALALGHGEGKPFAYPLEGAPCEEVVRDGFRVFPDGVTRRFPADRVLAEMGAESYAGVALKGRHDEAVGLLVMVDRRPVRDGDALERVLRMFAERAGGEMIRTSLVSQLHSKTVLLDGIFENMPAAIYVKGRDERFLLGNPAFERMVGLPPGGSAGRLCADIFGEAIAARMRPSNGRVMDTGSVALTREDIPLADGPHEFSLIRFPLRGPDGRIYALAGIATDVTAQAAVERARDESEARLRGLYESAFDGILLIDERARVVDCNPRAGELFGATAEQLKGRSIWDLSPELQADGVASRLRGRSLYHEITEGQRPVFEWRHRRLDGTTFDCEVASGLLALGERRLCFGIIRDTTERQDALRELRLLQAAVNATAAGIMVTDTQGLIRWVNPAFTRLTGYAAEEVLGRSTRMLRSGSHAGDFYARMWATISRGEVWSGELHNRRRDGTLYHERMVISPVCDASGAISSFVAVKEDVTHERELEDQLKRSQRLESIGMLAGGIAHDLNNVLSPILLSIELMKVDDPTPRQADRLALMAQAAVRGAGIVKQVLTFARGIEGERVALDPRHLVRDIAELARETFPRNIEIAIEADPDPGLVVGDVTQLHQVLLNLAVNARDAMPRGGRLLFRLRRCRVGDDPALRARRLEPGEYVELEVEDTGTGIPPEVMEHMFEPFFTTKPRGKGTGLGLSTVYGIVRGHAGTIDARSEPGKGSTFRVLLPLAAVPAPAPAPAVRPTRFDGAGRLVLLVDDEESIRTVGTIALGRLGFHVVAAPDGFEALDLFRQRPQAFALAIVDHMMPRMNGVELSRELVALRPDLRIISSTGLGPEPGADRDSAEDMRALGIVTRLEKPYTIDGLVAALEAELGAGARPLQRRAAGLTPPSG